MFYERLEAVCKSKGTTITTVVKALKLGTGSGTKWKNGALPNIEIAKRIADYLEVSVDYLLSEEDDLRFSPLNEIDMDLLKLFHQLPERDQLKFIGRLEGWLEEHQG